MEQACDIQDLCLAAGMDPSRYVTFTVDEAPDDAEPVFAHSIVREAITTDKQRPSAVAAPVAPPLTTQQAHVLSPIEFRAPAQTAPSAIHAAPAPVAYVYSMPSAMPTAPLIHSEPLRPTEPVSRVEPVLATPRRRNKPRLAAALQRHQGVALHAVAGGCGATTIAATVAHMLAARGEHIVLGDGSSLPMLPAHFGATHLSRGTWSLLPGRRRDAGALHILSNADPADGASFSQGWFAQEMAVFPHPWNRLLLDVSSSATTELDGLDEERLMVILVVHPGPAARVRLPLLLDEYREQGIVPFVLLNRFNADKPTHTAMRDDLRKRLGKALLPFEVRASQAVPEALDEGLTVDESAPDGDVTADFRLLTDWVQANAGPLAIPAENRSAAGQGDVQ